MVFSRKATKLYVVDPIEPELHIVEEAGGILRRGGLVAFPTETVYGLGADALNPRAVQGIFAAKGRPADNPLIAHIADRADLGRLVSHVSPTAALLMERFWPGPLTVVLPRHPGVPDTVTAGLTTVAVRMPAHPVALELIRAAGVSVAAPSANASGKPSPTTAAHVLADLDGRIDAILDGGPCGVGVESTVVDLSGPVPLLLRPGGVTVEELRELLPHLECDPALGSDSLRPKSPGMKYTHYTPEAEVIVLAGEDPATSREMAGMVQRFQGEGKRVGVMVTDELIPYLEQCMCRPDFLGRLGSRKFLEEAAARLFGLLRECDRHELDVVLAEGVPETGLGLAVMNRLRRAAGHRVVSAR